MLSTMQLMLICHHFHTMEEYTPMTSYVGQSYKWLIEEGFLKPNNRLTDRAMDYLKGLPRYED